MFVYRLDEREVGSWGYTSEIADQIVSPGNYTIKDNVFGSS